MRISKDRAAFEAAQEAAFVERCKEEFTEASLAAANRKKVEQLTLASYLPNVISATTAGFFVFYLLTGYRWQIALFLGFLLLLVILATEAGKRLLIASLGKEYFLYGKAPLLAILALLACFGLSMTASYIGGKQLVVETATPPPRQVSPEADSLRQLLAHQEATIARLQRTTWKGKVTRKAQAGIREAKQLQNQLYSRISTLESQADTQHQEALAKHTAKHLNFGVVLGLLAALADAFLFGLLWTAKRLKYQVAAIHLQPAQASPLPQQGYKIPQLGSQPPQNLNRAGKRPIGFFTRPQGEAEPEPAPPAEPETGPEPEGPANGTVSNATVTADLQPGEKLCLNCESVYRYKVNWQKFCCPECKAEFHARKHGGEPFQPKKYHRTKNRTA